MSFAPLAGALHYICSLTHYIFLGLVFPFSVSFLMSSRIIFRNSNLKVKQNSLAFSNKIEICTNEHLLWYILDHVLMCYTGHIFYWEMQFVTKDLREEIEESTHVNILRDNITLISFFLWKSWCDGYKRIWILSCVCLSCCLSCALFSHWIHLMVEWTNSQDNK
jgi:hypothetical protein